MDDTGGVRGVGGREGDVDHGLRGVVGGGDVAGEFAGAAEAVDLLLVANLLVVVVGADEIDALSQRPRGVGDDATDEEDEDATSAVGQGSTRAAGQRRDWGWWVSWKEKFQVQSSKFKGSAKIQVPVRRACEKRGAVVMQDLLRVLRSKASMELEPWPFP